MNQQPEFESAWVDMNTQIIEAEIRAARRKVWTRAFGWVVAIITGAALFSLIFWAAIAAAQHTAEIAPMMMRF